VDKDTYLQTTESMQSDYSVVMPLPMKVLFDNRARYQEMTEREGEEQLVARQPKARGYLRPPRGLPPVRTAGQSHGAADGGRGIIGNG
jgi:deoxyhypusine synthase